MDRQKALKAAEKQLSAGKVERAVAELKRLVRESSDDPLTINRIGDTLARHNQREAAIEVYGGLGSRYAEGGFLPKAIAIYKKIHRLAPDDIETATRLGDLYLRQKLPGEARGYLLAAVDECVARQDNHSARAVLERLVEAEPDVGAHRDRLAEILVASGDREAACDQLLELGRRLLDRDEGVDAESAYRRANDLVADNPTALQGISRSLLAQGRDEESLAILESALDEGGASTGEVIGELVLRYEQSGQVDASMALLRREDASAIPPRYFQESFRHHLDAGSVPALWERISPIFNEWSVGAHEDRLIRLLQALADIEDDGHIPALQWMVDLLKARGDRQGLGRTLERLIGAYQSRCMVDEASLMMDQLRKVAPESPLLSDQPHGGGEESLPLSETIEAVADPTPGVASPRPPTSEDSVDLAAEAPAVPLDRAEEAFASGRLTQAEILEKYGLASQAIAQVREVVDRFPGHVEAQDRLVLLLRGQGDPSVLARALSGLALAARAAGDLETARNSAEEAWQTGHVDGEMRDTFVRLGLIAGPATAAAATAAEPAEGDDADLIIDFDDAEPAQAPAAAPAPAPTAPPSDASILADICTLLDGTDWVEARKKIDAVRTLGYSGADLDALEARLSAHEAAAAAAAAAAATATAAPAPPAANGVEPTPPAPPAEPAVVAEPAESAEPVPAAQDDGLFDDDDLAALTAALDSEIFEREAPAPPEAEAEQSVDEVLAQFREQVKEQVDDADYRTHYDLGIAYKEMGLVEQAIDEFQMAVQSDDKLRDACVMLARCHLEQQNAEDAVAWYRKALDAPGGDKDASASLRYELAELLLNTGDNGEALVIFRAVMEASPGFRDVADRVAQLESGLAE